LRGPTSSLETADEVASLGASTLDTLPHSAAVVSLLAICGLSHAAAYRGIFMTTVVGPTLGLMAALII
jgi:H+/gluconate symporter-like permease